MFGKLVFNFWTKPQWIKDIEDKRQADETDV
jgi:hypothetical protein